MRAIVCTRYGPPEVLLLQEVEKPSIKPDGVLVRVHATTVTRGDVLLRNVTQYPSVGERTLMRIAIGWGRPRRKVLGVEFAGKVEATGKDVTRFKAGDAVFGTTGFRFGCYAEYVAIRETKTLERKPSTMTFGEAAAVPVGATTALHYLQRKGRIQRGQRVLIYGASGSVGTFAVQLAKHFGAEVTGVCSSTNLELVRSLGADQVIDYAREDFTLGGERYDLVFDAVGKTAPSRSKRVLSKGGTFVSSTRGLARDNPEYLTFFKRLAEAGELKSAIDRRFSLEQIVEAHAYVDQGHKRGNVVLTVVPASE